MEDLTRRNIVKLAATGAASLAATNFASAGSPTPSPTAEAQCDTDHLVNAAMNEAILAYRGELVRRSFVEVPIDLFEAKADGNVPGFPGGSMIVASGLAQTPFMKAMRAAAKKRDAHAVGALLREHKESVERSELNSTLVIPTDATAQVGEVPVLTEVSYRGKVLVDGLPVVPEFAATAALLPFAGGRLDEHNFVASHFLTPEAPDQTNLDTIIIYRQPQLTPLEVKGSIR